MKNLAKKAKAKIWQAVTLGVLTAVTLYKIMFALMKLACLTPEIYQTVTHDTFIQIITILTSFVIGLIVFSSAFDVIFSKAKKYKRELREQRHANLMILIEKCIDNNDKTKSEFLYNQYLKFNFCDKENACFLDGAIRGKFYTKLNIELI